MAKRFGPTTASVSLLCAALAYWPSAAAFTPAILLSLVGAIGAAAGLFLGAVRLSLLTFAVVSFTALVSPLFSDIAGGPRGAYLVVGIAPAAIAVLAVLLLWDFKRRSAA